MYQVNQAAALRVMEWIAGAITGLCFLGLIISGGLVSIEKPMPAILLTMHRILPFLTVFSTAVTLFLLIGRN
jgi:ABC-type multidrug transport system permease subunit